EAQGGGRGAENGATEKGRRAAKEERRLKRMLPGWSRIEIAGKAAEAFDPPAGPPPRWALLWLHPESGESPAGNNALSAALRHHGLPCVAPHGNRSWWADRVCPEFDPALTAEQHLLRNVVPWMEERWSLPPRAVGVAGLEMGG